jgi:hypothetical protein
MTTEDTPMTPAAPVVDERQKALDRYKERLLKHRCVQRRGGVPSWADLAVHACVPAPAGPPPRVPQAPTRLARPLSPQRRAARGGPARRPPGPTPDLRMPGRSGATVLRLRAPRSKLDWPSLRELRSAAFF